MRDNYDYVLQENNFDCGVAALKTIFLQLGRHIKTEDIVTKRINQGLTALDLIKASQKLNVPARGVKTSIKEINYHYLPCIAHVIKDKNYYHYMVILKNYKSKKYLIVMDPAIGIKRMSYQEFNEMTTSVFIIFDNKKILKNSDKRFINLLKEIAFNNKKIIIKSLGLSLFVIFLSLSFNYFLTLVLKYNSSYPNIIIISLIFFMISIFKNFIQYFRDKITLKLNQRIDQEMQKKVINHIIKLPYQYYCNKSIGEYTILVGDLENVKVIITKIFILVFIDSILLLTILCFSIFFSIYYFIVFLSLFFISLMIAFIYQKKFNNYFLSLKANNISFRSILIETFMAYNSIKNLKLENKMITKINKKNIDLLNDNYKYNKNNTNYQFFNDGIVEIFYILIVLIASLLALKTNTSIFNIVLFSNLFYLFVSFLNSINENIVTYKVFKSSINKILDVLEIKKEDSSKKVLNFANISFKNLSFSYGEKEIIKNLNLDINKKDHILLEGNSGSGKTTLIKLLLKYYEADSGNIFFDNRNVKYLNSNSIRSNITYISQEESLFNDTVYNNLAIINNNEKLITKVKELCLIKLDNNYFIEENGLNISGGERKKLLIARGLLRNSKLIVFDESFNELDQTSERLILQNIMNYYQDLTIILITHRKNNRFLFNKCYELINGKLVKEE